MLVMLRVSVLIRYFLILALLVFFYSFDLITYEFHVYYVSDLMETLDYNCDRLARLSRCP